MKKILFFILLVFFLLANPKTIFATEASLKCSPTTGSFRIGDVFTVDYVLDTRTFQAFGANVVATFDSEVLEVVEGQSTAITTSTSWNQPTTNTIDSTLGKINLEYGQNQTVYTGSTPIGKITFRTKSPGQAQFNFTFFQQYDDTTPGVAKVFGKRDDVNITNILTDVNNCIYVVEGTGITPTQASVTLPPGVPTYTPIPPPPVTSLPRAGRMENTFSFTVLSLILLAIGSISAWQLVRAK